MSKGFTGFHHTEDSKESISLAKKGKHCSPETEFKPGKLHPNYGKHLSKDICKKISFANFGEKHHKWKGNNVAMSTLHQWIAKIKPKPSLCEDCKEVSPVDVANISGKYKRDINDFKWVCRRCHMKSDGVSWSTVSSS